MKMFDEVDFDYSKLGFNEKQLDNGIIISSLDINEKNDSFEIGKYRIVSCENLYIISKKVESILKENIKSILKDFICEFNIDENSTILICGLGNNSIIADSFGPKCCKNILSTRLLNKNIVESNICCLCPNVQSITGIKTFDIVYGVANQIEARLIILIDSFLTDNIKRLGHSFQLSNIGMTPGGAIVENKKISKKTTDINCISIGIPFMLNLKNICKDINKNIIVSVKDISYMIDKCSKILADCLNELFNKSLTKDEIDELLNPI